MIFQTPLSISIERFGTYRDRTNSCFQRQVVYSVSLMRFWTLLVSTASLITQNDRQRCSVAAANGTKRFSQAWLINLTWFSRSVVAYDEHKKSPRKQTHIEKQQKLHKNYSKITTVYALCFVSLVRSVVAHRMMHINKHRSNKRTSQYNKNYTLQNNNCVCTLFSLVSFLIFVCPLKRCSKLVLTFR